MKSFTLYLLTALLGIALLNACGPSEEEIQQREQARQDSLEQARQQQMEQIRQDSIEQARQDSIAAAEREEEEEQEQISFDENGDFSVQVESWRSEEKAAAQVAKWKERGFENAFVVTFNKNEDRGDVWYRVRLGQLATLEDAERLGEQLEEEYQASYWTSRVSDEEYEED